MFVSREEAGQMLGRRLAELKNQSPCILALPRGGVPVAFAVAEELEAPLDLLLVHKIGAPFQPELALGAVVDGQSPEIILNEDLLGITGVSPSYIEHESAKQLKEIERRHALYLAGRPRLDISNRIAIVIDDGIATGATTRAALRAARRAQPKRLLLAVPVAPIDTLAELQGEANDILCLEAHERFGSVGSHYANFRQVGDDEVRELLARARTTYYDSKSAMSESPS